MRGTVVPTQILKQQIQEKLRGNDFECHYFEAIFNTTSDLIALTDGDRVIDANKPFVEFFAQLGHDVFDPAFHFPKLFETINKFGYLYDGYQNMRWFEHLLNDTRDNFRVGIMEENTVHTFNLTLNDLEGFEDVYVLTLTDVTEMMGYKAALEEGIKSSVKDREKTQFMLRQYDKAVESSTLVYKCDLNGIIIHANHALSDALLYDRNELVGKHISVLKGPNVDEEGYVQAWNRLKQGYSYRGILENVDKVGGLHYFDVSMTPIFDQEGRIVEFLSIRHEITEVMRAKEEAVKTLESKTKFFDQVSHELRTPLNAIINFTDQALENFEEIFEDEETRDLVRMYIERSHKNSQHLLHLINSLLDMAKLRSGKEKYDMVAVNIHKLVQHVYDTTSSLNTKPALEYMIELCDEEIYVHADELKLQQVLINLISNAIKFTEWGYVRLRVYRCGSECCIDIEDTGHGIPKHKLEVIFEPFEQVGTGDQGTGLGLGIVNEYVKAMKMKLEVVSEEDSGSCFTLKIPTIKTEREGSQWSI